MKIRVVSDLHLEFDDINIVNHDGCNVLILSGDILVAQDLHDHPEPANAIDQTLVAGSQGIGRRQESAQRFRDFLKRCSIQFPKVVYVAGNHEFYHGKWIDSIRILHEECAKFPNLHFLENDSVTIDNITFVGATLWTDMNRGDPVTQWTVQEGMNDFKIIRHDGLGYIRVRPTHVIQRHKESLQYIQAVLDADPRKRYVVVTHHSPSTRSIHERYVGDMHMNGAYASNLENFIIDRPQIALWTHGHVHSPFDYEIGDTRIVCNPRGYERFEDSGWDKYKTIEL